MALPLWGAILFCGATVSHPGKGMNADVVPDLLRLP
jgi:hypothetical protein